MEIVPAFHERVAMQFARLNERALAFPKEKRGDDKKDGNYNVAARIIIASFHPEFVP